MSDPEIELLRLSIAALGMVNPLYVNMEYGRYTVHPGQNRVIALRRMGRKYAPALIHTRYGHCRWAIITPTAAAKKFSGNRVAEYHDPRFFAVKRTSPV